MVNAGLGDPTDLERDQRAEEFLGRLGVGNEVIIDKEEIPPRLGGDLCHHLGDGPCVMAVTEVLADRAELAVETAAAAKLEQAHGQVFLSGIQVPARENSRLGNPERAIVARSQPSLVRVGNHLRPERLAVTGIDGVRVLGHLVGEECRVHPAHHHRHLPRPVFGGDLVGAARGECFDVDGDQVGWLIVVDLVDAVIEQAAVHARRGQSRQDTQRQRLHAPFVDEPFAVVQAAKRRFDEGHLHLLYLSLKFCRKSLSWQSIVICTLNIQQLCPTNKKHLLEYTTLKRTTQNPRLHCMLC